VVVGVVRRLIVAGALCALCLLAGCASTVGTGQAPAASDASTGLTDAHAGRSRTTGPAPPGETVSATVVRVADGDTVDVRFANGSADTVRIVGADTPEVWVRNTPDEYAGVPNTTAGRDCLRTWGHRASDFAHRRLGDSEVVLAFDPNTDRRGYYGRLLAYVYVNGTNYDYALVRDGLARVYDASDFTMKSRFARAADAARARREGLWQCATTNATATNDATNGVANARLATNTATNDATNGVANARLATSWAANGAAP